MIKILFLIVSFLLFYNFNYYASVQNIALFKTGQKPTSVKKDIFTEQEALLRQERTTNLVILNDNTEILYPSGTIAMRLGLSQAFSQNQLILCTKAVWLAFKFYAPFVMPEEYISKQVNDDYILFVPKKMQHADQSFKVQDALLGLSYTKFLDYNYKISDQKELHQVQARSKGQNLSPILLTALEKLKIKDIDPELLPFYNIFLTGHGGPGVIAQISSKSDKADTPSDFLKVMNFFNTLRTKSVVLSSCFIGSKQIIDTYGMYDNSGKPIFDKFSNQTLEQLSYPIINWGSLFKVVYSMHNFNFSEYFNSLNEPVPDYQKILKKIQLGDIDNYISIKLPHTSWFSSVQLKEETQSLSQIAMSSAQKTVTIKNTTKVIILEANYIPQSVDCATICTLMPVNYYNQSYYFKSLQFKSLYSNTNLFEVLKKLVFINTVKEPINFAFEKIQIGSTVYKNVRCFIYVKNSSTGLPRTGFIYENPDGDVFGYGWSSVGEAKDLPNSLNDLSVNSKVLDKENWQKEFETLIDEIKEGVVESRRPEFFQELASKIHVKQKERKLSTNLTKLNLQLHANLGKPQDLADILPSLEKAINKKSKKDQGQKVFDVFDTLVSKKIITSDNFSELIPLLNRGFNSSHKFVRTQIVQMLNKLIDQKIITTENWTDLIPVFEQGMKNNNEIKISVAVLIRKLISDRVILSIKKIYPIFEEGLKNSDFEVGFKIYGCLYHYDVQHLLTKSEVEHFIQITTNEEVKRSLESLEDQVPETLPDQKPLSRAQRLLASIQQSIDNSQLLDQKQINTFHELINLKEVSFEQVKSLIEKNLNNDKLNHFSILIPLLNKEFNSSNNLEIVQLLNKLLAQKMITKENWQDLIPLFQEGMKNPNADIKLNVAELIQKLIRNRIIGSVKNISSILEEGFKNSDFAVGMRFYSCLYLCNNQHLVTKSDIQHFIQITMNQEVKGFLESLEEDAPESLVSQLLESIQQSIDKSEFLNEEQINRFNELIHLKEINFEQAMSLIEKNLNNDNPNVQINILLLCRYLIVGKIVQEDTIEQFLSIMMPWIKKDLMSSDYTIFDHAAHMILDLLQKQLLKSDLLLLLLKDGFLSIDATIFKNTADVIMFLLSNRSVSVDQIMPLIKEGLNSQNAYFVIPWLNNNLITYGFLNTEQVTELLPILKNDLSNDSLMITIFYYLLPNLIYHNLLSKDQMNDFLPYLQNHINDYAFSVWDPFLQICMGKNLITRSDIQSLLKDVKNTETKESLQKLLDQLPEQAEIVSEANKNIPKIQKPKIVRELRAEQKEKLQKEKFKRQEAQERAKRYEKMSYYKK